jgi:hypothetical protein
VQDIAPGGGPSNDQGGNGGPRFRVTVWPGGPIPVPKMTPWSIQVLDGRFLYYDIPQPEVALPEEMFLREVMDCDPADPETAIRFTTTCGVLTGFGERTFEYLPPTETYRGPFPGLLHVAAQYAETANLHPNYVVSLEAVRLHLGALRAMVRHWDAHLAGAPPEALVAAWIREGMSVLPDEREAWRVFGAHLNAAIRPFQAHIELASPDGIGVLAGRPSANLYSALCLQLMNEMAASSTFRRCANETCGRLFVRQRGGSRYGQHRSDAMYCTPECARMQAQRQYRRRKRAQEGGS